MSESYDSFADIGEPHRMAPEGVITDENIEQLTQLATAPIDIEGEIQVQEVEETNQMEATIKEKVNRKKQRSEKQKATFEKARQKRLENIANKKSQRKEKENQVLEEMNENSSPDKTPDTLEQGSALGGEPIAPILRNPTMEEDLIPRHLVQDPPIKKKKKKQKVVYIDPSSSEEESSEEEIIYVKQRKKAPQKRQKKVVYQDDYGEQAEFQQRPRRNKPISFSDVFKYS
tara:strand:+ start:477 stop:1166 length:690 start_codon:yes stop_codon:yes gene_type:complete